MLNFNASACTFHVASLYLHKIPAKEFKFETIKCVLIRITKKKLSYRRENSALASLQESLRISA